MGPVWVDGGAQASWEIAHTRTDLAGDNLSPGNCLPQGPRPGRLGCSNFARTNTW